MPSNGISKNSDSKSKDSVSSVEKALRMADSGSLSQQKLESGMQQASVSYTNSNGINQPSRDEYHPDQAQQDAPVDNDPTSQGNTIIESVESDEIEMQDLSANRKIENQQQSTQKGPLDVQSGPNRPSVSSSHEQNTDKLVEGLRCLAILDPPKKLKKDRLTQDQDFESDVIVDGWGTLRNSSFVIVQEGPPHAATYRFRYKKDYTNDRTANISDRDFRISDIRDRAVNGKKIYRYSSENIVCFSGATFENLDARFSTRDTCSYVRVQWQGLRKEDQEMCKISQGYSWIPRASFERFFKRSEATVAKIKQVWDTQERQYMAWAQESGRGNGNRSTTPCPLNESLSRLQQQRATSRLRTPAVRTFYPAYDPDGSPPPSRHHDVAGIRFNPVSHDVKTENINSPTWSESASANAMSNESYNRTASESRWETPIVEFSKADFMKRKATEGQWEQKTPSEREVLQIRAEALFEIYKATMLQNNAREVHNLGTADSTEEEY